MPDDRHAEIDALEARLRLDPDSQQLRDALLSAYSNEQLANDPRRVGHIAEYVSRYPRHESARCARSHVDPEGSPDGFWQVEQEWLRHFRELPTDPEVAIGFALFVAMRDTERALGILRGALLANPESAALWTEMGNVCPEPAERLYYLKEARRLGSTQPNLLVWIGRAALDSGELEEAKRAGRELLSLVEQARSVHGERPRVSGDSYRTHWGHTVLGVVAARSGELSAARQHLRDSVSLAGDHRLSADGPSFSLARELCARSEWDAVASYLQACEGFWRDERLPIWSAEVTRRQAPDFPSD